MTQLLEQVIKRLHGLAERPVSEQERIASDVLATLDKAEQEEATEGYWLGGRKPTQEEATEAGKQIKELRKGITLGEDLTIRDMIEEGRR